MNISTTLMYSWKLNNYVGMWKQRIWFVSRALYAFTEQFIYFVFWLVPLWTHLHLPNVLGRFGASLGPVLGRWSGRFGAGFGPVVGRLMADSKSNLHNSPDAFWAVAAEPLPQGKRNKDISTWPADSPWVPVGPASPRYMQVVAFEPIKKGGRNHSFKTRAQSLKARCITMCKSTYVEFGCCYTYTVYTGKYIVQYTLLLLLYIHHIIIHSVPSIIVGTLHSIIY